MTGGRHKWWWQTFQKHTHTHTHKVVEGVSLCVSGKHTQRVVLVFLGPSTGPFATVSVARTDKSGFVGRYTGGSLSGQSCGFFWWIVRLFCSRG
jgi:hypothetical protein